MIHLGLLVLAIVICEILIKVNLFELIKENLIIYKKFIKFLSTNFLSNDNYEKEFFENSKKILLISIKIFMILILIFLLFFFIKILNKNFYENLISLSGMIEITLFALIYGFVRKFINAKL